ncbi:MAG: pfkB family carbohydrate kinase [Candidatus Bathyarchaeota archaeon BA2]|nr:MAG: pfkB family carbohydrate kinase [Candidatus Bathyarchaeota archaeon BA2]
MSLTQSLEELLHFLEKLKPAKKFSVVVMPDFFLDRLVTYEGDVKHFSRAVAEVAGRKGGSIHGIKQLELRGGNAANTAAALAALGAQVYPILDTSPLGLHLLKFYLGPFGVDLSHVKTSGRMSLTTAIELNHEGERVNVMMSDLGSLSEFGLDNITPKDFQVLREANYVCIFHWAGTRRWGTKLAEGIFSYVRKEGKGKTYYDTADPSPKKEGVSELVEKILSGKLVDIFSVNESEAFCYACQLDKKVGSLRKTMKLDELAKECARILAKNLSARIDLHTTTFAGSLIRDSEVMVPAFKVSVLRATGAGDAWNAGNIFGDALGLPTSCRLTLANAVAACYISSPVGEHPTLPKLVDFCSKQLQKIKG